MLFGRRCSAVRRKSFGRVCQDPSCALSGDTGGAALDMASASVVPAAGIVTPANAAIARTTERVFP
jgi:hypothetical protein